MDRRHFVRLAGLGLALTAGLGKFGQWAAHAAQYKEKSQPESPNLTPESQKTRWEDSASSWTQSLNQTREGEMIYRMLGSTGEKVSAIGLGGFHIGVPDEKEGVRIIQSAVDRGITFMDNCWDYHNGKSEERMGAALKADGRRDKVFLMTKIDGRTKDSAAKQIDECLRRLQTDRVDLCQFHEIIRMEDADYIFG